MPEAAAAVPAVETPAAQPAAPPAAAPAAQPAPVVDTPTPAQPKGRKAYAKELGFADEAEMQAAIEAGKESLAKQRELEAAKADPTVKLQKQIEKLTAERDAAVLKEHTGKMREEVRTLCQELNVAKGAEELIMHALGLGEVEFRAVRKDGKTVLVDADGDPITDSLKTHLSKLVGKAKWLQAGITSDDGDAETAPKTPKAPTAAKPKTHKELLKYVDEVARKAAGGN